MSTTEQPTYVASIDSARQRWQDAMRRSAERPTQPLPPSANGYALQVNGHTLTASWAAPFYVLVIGRLGWSEERDEEPLLIHCETLEDARSSYRCWQGETYILDAKFEKVEDQRVD